MSAGIVLAIFGVLFAAHFVGETVLDILNVRHLARHPEVPAYMADLVTDDTYAKSIAYTRAKTHFGIVRRSFSALVTWVLILSGAFGALNSWLDGSRLAYVFCVGLFLYAVQLPFSMYNQFGLEQRFGFNKSSFATFIVDQIKGLAIAAALGIPLLLLMFWFIDATGSTWWLWAFGAFMAFQLLTAALFPVLLAPIFYKFTLLENSTLRDRIVEMARRIQFKMADVFTIDGSRRSSHSNAFFAGFGKTRRVVLFDTLMTSLSEDEIIAVVAHEMGHDKLKHIQRQLVLSTLSSLLGFYVLSLAITWPAFYGAFGAGQPQSHVGLVLFALFSGVATFMFQPLFQYFSRRYEYEADRFSVDTTRDKASLKGALKKLAKDNLSNLTPHPWYSFFHYSHPALAERISAIEKAE